MEKGRKGERKKEKEVEKRREGEKKRTEKKIYNQLKGGEEGSFNYMHDPLRKG